MTRLTGLSLLAGTALVLCGGPELAAAPAPLEATAGRLVTIPAGAMLRVRVDRAFGSDISRLEEPVSATLARPVFVDGRRVLSAGSILRGHVTRVVRPGRVKGRGRVAVRFSELRPADDEERYEITTRPWTAVAPATKKKDALTIGVPAAGGAVIGGLIGGKKGAGVGALTAGGAGTAVVLATRGRDVRIGKGATLLVRLTRPVTVRLP